ncbi:hypothetical protein Bbelb_063140 [Branchiostoma belcheri]|nr:hypothetical protein Bbelb_063140 [Branchiostoma belcheri]
MAKFVCRNYAPRLPPPCHCNLPSRGNNFPGSGETPGPSGGFPSLVCRPLGGDPRCLVGATEPAQEAMSRAGAWPELRFPVLLPAPWRPGLPQETMTHAPIIPSMRPVDDQCFEAPCLRMSCEHDLAARTETVRRVGGKRARTRQSLRV